MHPSPPSAVGQDDAGHDRCHTTHDRCHTTHDRCHTTHDRCHTTHDRCHTTGQTRLDRQAEKPTGGASDSSASQGQHREGGPADDIAFIEKPFTAAGLRCKLGSTLKGDPAQVAQ
ncbi:hypothetical protein ACWKSP_39490 [Micromonosporaceae bacterium Da 78-11]